MPVQLTLVSLNTFMYYTPPNVYHVNLQHNLGIFTTRVENKVDPNQMASSTLFSKEDISGFSRTRVRLLAFMIEYLHFQSKPLMNL